jgi:hypothetical protein
MAGRSRPIGNLLANLGWTREGQRRQDLAVTPIAEALARAGDGQVVKIRGRVVAAAEGTVVAPFTGRRAVAAHVRYLKRSAARVPGLLARAPIDDWNAELDEHREVPFWIDDGTGLALVLVHVASVVAPFEDVVVPPAMRVAAGAFLEDRGVVRAPSADDARTLEALIAPGDGVEVVGPARREAVDRGPAGPSGPGPAYRDAAPPSLVLFAGEGAEGMLSVRKAG